MLFWSHIIHIQKFEIYRLTFQDSGYEMELCMHDRPVCFEESEITLTSAFFLFHFYKQMKVLLKS